MMRKRDRENTCGSADPITSTTRRGRYAGPRAATGGSSRSERAPRRGDSSFPTEVLKDFLFPLRGHLDDQHLPHPQRTYCAPRPFLDVPRLIPRLRFLILRLRGEVGE